MLIVAVVVCFLPWTTEAGFGMKLKYWIAAFLVWGGICSAVPFWLRNAFGQTITIDTRNRTVAIKRHVSPLLSRLGIQTNGPSTQVISWVDILGFQVCYQKVPGDSERNGYQLILVWRDPQGRIQRHCVLKHAIKKFVVALGNHYVSLFRFELIDCTKDSQQAGGPLWRSARRGSPVTLGR